MDWLERVFFGAQCLAFVLSVLLAAAYAVGGDWLMFSIAGANAIAAIYFAREIILLGRE